MFMPALRRNWQKGVSLIEVLVGVVVISVALIAITNVVIKALQAADYARSKTEATKLGTQAIEWIRVQKESLGWTQFSAITGDYCLNDALATLDWTSLPGACTTWDLNGRYKRQLNLSAYADCAETACGGGVDCDSLKITLIVSWQNDEREVRNITCINHWSD